MAATLTARRSSSETAIDDSGVDDRMMALPSHLVLTPPSRPHYLGSLPEEPAQQAHTQYTRIPVQYSSNGGSPTRVYKSSVNVTSVQTPGAKATTSPPNFFSTPMPEAGLKKSSTAGATPSFAIEYSAEEMMKLLAVYRQKLLEHQELTERLKATLRQLASERDSAYAALQRSPRGGDHTSSHHDTINTSISASDREMLASLSSRNAELTSLLDQARSQASMYKAQLETITRRNTTISSKRESSLESQMAALRLELEDAMGQVRHWRARYDSLRTETQQHEASIERSQHQHLLEQISSTRQQLTTTDARYHEQTENLRSLAAELLDVREQLRASQVQAQQNSQQIIALLADKEKDLARARAAEEEARSSAALVANLRTDLDVRETDIDAKLRTITSLEFTIAQLHAQIDQLRADIVSAREHHTTDASTLNALQSDLVQYRAISEEKDRQILELRRLVEAARQSEHTDSSIVTRLETRIVSLEHEIETYRNEITTLHTRLSAEEARTATDAARADESEGLVGSLRMQLDALRERHRVDLAAWRAAESDLVQKVSLLTRELSEASSARGRVETELSTLRVQTTQITESTVVSLRAEADTARLEARALRQRLDDSHAEIEGLRRELDAAREAEDGLRDRLAKEKMLYASLGQEQGALIEQHRRHADELRVETTRLRAELTRVMQLLSDTEANGADRDGQLARLTAEVVALREQCLFLSSAQETARMERHKDLVRWEELLLGKDATISTLQMSVDSQRASLRHAEEDVQRLHTALVSAQTGKDASEQSLRIQDEQIAALRNQTSHQATIIQQLERTVSSSSITAHTSHTYSHATLDSQALDDLRRQREMLQYVQEEYHRLSARLQVLMADKDKSIAQLESSHAHICEVLMEQTSALQQQVRTQQTEIDDRDTTIATSLEDRWNLIRQLHNESQRVAMLVNFVTDSSLESEALASML